MKPCVEPSARRESPTTSPCALIARAWLVSPPSVPSETSVYRGGSGATVGVAAAAPPAAHPVGGGADSVSATPITSDHMALLAQRTGRPQGRPPVRCRRTAVAFGPASGAGGSPAGGWFGCVRILAPAQRTERPPRGRLPVRCGRCVIGLLSSVVPTGAVCAGGLSGSEANEPATAPRAAAT